MFFVVFLNITWFLAFDKFLAWYLDSYLLCLWFCLFVALRFAMPGNQIWDTRLGMRVLGSLVDSPFSSSHLHVVGEIAAPPFTWPSVCLPLQSVCPPRPLRPSERSELHYSSQVRRISGKADFQRAKEAKSMIHHRQGGFQVSRSSSERKKRNQWL